MAAGDRCRDAGWVAFSRSLTPPTMFRVNDATDACISAQWHSMLVMEPLAHWFPTWGKLPKFPNLVMGLLIWEWAGFFFLFDQNRETGTGKTRPTVAYTNDNGRIKIGC